jgi:hypothetical protein
MPSATEFDAAERAAIVAQYDWLAAQPTRPNITSVGCVMVLLAIVILLTFPRFGRNLPRAINVAALVSIAVLAVAGVLIYFFGGGGGYARASLRANEGLELLSKYFATSNAEEKRSAAVAMIFYAIYSDGPGSTSTYDFDKAREQLGPALEYVQAVERVLLAERKPYPIFTHEPDKDEPTHKG